MTLADRKPASKEQAIEEIAQCKATAVTAGTSRLPFVVYHIAPDDDKSLEEYFFSCLANLSEDLKTKVPEGRHVWVGNDDDGMPVSTGNLILVEWFLTKRYSAYTAEFWQAMLKRTFSNGENYCAYDGPFTPWPTDNDPTKKMTVADSLRKMFPEEERDGVFQGRAETDLNELSVVTKATMLDLIDSLSLQLEEEIAEMARLVKLDELGE